MRELNFALIMLFTFIYSIQIYIVETFYVFLWPGGGAPKIDGQ